MEKEVYLSDIEWSKMYNNVGGVTATLVFKEPITFEEYEKLYNKKYILVEVLENKEIEKIDLYNCFRTMSADNSGRLDFNFQEITNKINELIDKVNDLEEKLKDNAIID